uniref:RING-type domain-containing protein n=1 Tax=Anabas testudineus TaxID=64144 RepID=A0A7N6BVI5_ANATE
MESSLVKDNPLLLPLNKEKTVYDGFITVQERDFRMRILLPADRQLKGAKLHCSWQLKHLLRGYEHIVKQVNSAYTFSMSLQEVGLKSRPVCRAISPPQYYSQLMSEMEALGWDKLLFIDTEFRTLRLKVEDSSGRQHILTIKLKSKHPAEAPECSADLPVPLALTWTPQSTLQQLHSQFVLVLESLTEFWDVLDEIDSQTWILEPEKPSRADTMRRIAIGNEDACRLKSAQLILNRGSPGICLWSAGRNPNSSVLHNLRDVLEITFPSPATHEKSDFSVDCGICYSYRLEAAIPDQVCNDPRCGQPFHQACLYEWLRALPSSRQSFNIVFGECPYCSKPITVKMAAQKS